MVECQTQNVHGLKMMLAQLYWTVLEWKNVTWIIVQNSHKKLEYWVYEERVVCWRELCLHRSCVSLQYHQVLILWRSSLDFHTAKIWGKMNVLLQTKVLMQVTKSCGQNKKVPIGMNSHAYIMLSRHYAYP